MCRYAYSILRDQEEAKDITQKIFYKLWDQKDKLEIHTSVKSYLYRIVHNDCINRIKQHRVRKKHNQSIVYEDRKIEDGADRPFLHSELEEEIERALANLPPRCREVFQMSRMQQLSYAEIAKELNISTNTVETQIVKALRILRVRLKDYLPILLLFIFHE